MGISTSTGTLVAGQTRILSLAPASTVTVTLLPNCRVTITESPAGVSGSGLGGNATRVHEPRLPGTFTYGPYPLGGEVTVEVASNSGSSVAWTETWASNSTNPHPRYWFHGWAPGQSTDDTVFRDMVAGNDGVFGADLPVANAWANKAKGYISNLDPAGGVTDSVIRIPGPAFDYANGESLLIMWAGQATPEGSEQQCMGSAGATSTGGVAIRCTATGRLAFAMYGGGTSKFSTTSTDNAAGKPFASAKYGMFGIFIDGQNRKQSMWVDAQINVNALTLSSGDSIDTLSSNTWNIGTATPAGGTNGLAMNTLAFAGFKFLATDALPSAAQMTAVMQAFWRNPGKLILAGAL